MQLSIYSLHLVLFFKINLHLVNQKSCIKNYQPLIGYFIFLKLFIFFVTLEIFLDAVFFVKAPVLATFIN